jgi:dGTPase
LVRRLIGRMTDDILAESQARIAALDPSSVEDIRAAGHAVIGFSDGMQQAVNGLREFLFQNMYRHRSVRRTTTKAKRVVRDLFDLYMSEPELLPAEWARRAAQPDSTETARAVADFIGGMTDRFALRDHEKLFTISAIHI